MSLGVVRLAYLHRPLAATLAKMRAQLAMLNSGEAAAVPRLDDGLATLRVCAWCVIVCGVVLWIAK